MRIKNTDDLETPLTAMIDIVFQLIIFFVVAASMERDILDYQINLAKSFNIATPLQPDPRTYTVNIRYTGENKPPVYSIAGRTVTIQEIQNDLLRANAQFGNETPVLIRASGELMYKYVDEVNTAIANAGLSRVRHSAEAGVKP
jgi:biopolymer transport protein ExbD